MISDKGGYGTQSLKELLPAWKIDEVRGKTVNIMGTLNDLRAIIHFVACRTLLWAAHTMVEVKCLLFIPPPNHGTTICMRLSYSTVAHSVGKLNVDLLQKGHNVGAKWPRAFLIEY